MFCTTDLIQSYILLSYEKLQRPKLSSRRRPVETSLRNRVLVYRFLKAIENLPISTIVSEISLNDINNNCENNFHDDIRNDIDDNSCWLFDCNKTYDNYCEIDMDSDSNLVQIADSNDVDNNSTFEPMTIDQTSDVNVLLKRAIGAERRQKLSTDNQYLNEVNRSSFPQITKTNRCDETEQFFHDLHSEPTDMMDLFFSSSSMCSFNFSQSTEQTLIH